LETVAEFGWIGSLVDFPFETSHDDLLDPLAFGVFEFAGSREADRVEHFQKAGKAAGVAIVRRGREEQSVFELGGDCAEGFAKVAIIPQR
jgi:hypothetical protein